MSSPLTQTEFHALTGPEITEIIVREVRRALETSGEFRNIYSYPQIDWEWTLSLRAYDRDHNLIPIETSGRVKNAEASKRIILEHEREFIERPDAVREELGLPTIQTTRRGGLVFDEPVGGSNKVQPKLERVPVQKAATLDSDNDLRGATAGAETGHIDFERERGINIKERPPIERQRRA